MRIVIVGAGLAGLACAARLEAAGHDVALFDKGRGPGGRMSSRRVATALGEASFDHGAQYFTVRDAGFRAQVDTWAAAGLAARWPAAGNEAWVGTPTMNAPVRALAAGLDVRWNATVQSLERTAAGWRVAGDGVDGNCDGLVIAIPAEQAGPLLAAVNPAWAARAAATPAAPCWTIMATFAERVPFAADVMREEGPIGWAARNSAKPGRAGPEAWVIQAGPAWSAAHLEETPAEVAPALMAAFAARVGSASPEALATTAHRWRYARSGAEGSEALWDPTARLGVCGDWLLGPRVECAWVSGVRLAERIGG